MMIKGKLGSKSVDLTEATEAITGLLDEKEIGGFVYLSKIENRGKGKKGLAAQLLMHGLTPAVILSFTENLLEEDWFKKAALMVMEAKEKGKLETFGPESFRRSDVDELVEMVQKR